MDHNNSTFFLDYLRYYYDNITPKLTLLFLFCLAISFTITFSGKIEKKDKSVFDIIAIHVKKILIPFVILCGLGSYLLAYIFAKTQLQEHISDEYLFKINNDLFAFFSYPFNYILIVFVSIFPSILHILYKRFITPHISAFLRRWRVTQADNELSDVKDEIEKLKIKRYDPNIYFKMGSIFIGLNKDDKPIYVSLEFFEKNHLKIVGPSQTGKGVELGLIIKQFIINGWGVWFNDIKPDDFIYAIMKETCEEFGFNFVVVDLTGEFEGLGYSPFINGSNTDRLTRIIKALRVKDTGKTADYYLAKNRSALYEVFPLWDGELESLLKLLKGNDSRLDEKVRITIRENTENLQTRLQEWLMYDSVKAKGKNNFNVLNAVKNKDVVYIRGAMHNDAIRGFNIALIEELTQVHMSENIEHRTLLGIDELRFLVTDTFANAFATVLSKNLTMAVTYQAKEDTTNTVEQTTNPMAIQNGIETNTQFSMYYRAQNPTTAEWIAQQSGKVNITTTKMEKVEANEVGGELWDKTRMLGREQQYLIPENVIITLPETIGVVIRPNHLAEIYYTSWVPLKHVWKLPKKAKSNSMKNSQPKNINKAPIKDNVVINSSSLSVNESKTELQAQALFEQLTEKKSNKPSNKPKDKTKVPDQNYVGIDDL